MFTPDPNDPTTQLLENNEPQPIPGGEKVRIKTWFLQKFIQRDSGEILTLEVVAVDEDSAWHMLQPSHNTGFKAPFFKIVGVSFANIYANAIDGMRKDPTLTPDQKKEIIKKAFDDELAQARNHTEYPRNPNIKDISGGNVTDPRVLNNLPR